MRFQFRELKESNVKLDVMKECDDAYTISVLGRPSFKEIFDKIDKNAVFIAAYTETGEVAGYSAFYANDSTSKKAFLTLFCVKKKMQRMHLGQQLMQMSIEKAKLHGMTTMGLEVLETDLGARMFYKQQMFVDGIGNSHEGFIFMYRDI